jgi:uncharacterized protein YeaO (DUF488 family)
MIRTGRIGIDKGIDITVKGNPNHVLAPTWDMVMAFKKGKITWDYYRRKYLNLLIERYKTRKKEFIDLIEQAKVKDIVLLCYCKDERFCHRTLAKEFLENLNFFFNT